MVSATTAAIIYMGVMQEPACQTDTGADDSIIKADIRVRQDGNDVSTWVYMVLPPTLYAVNFTNCTTDSGHKEDDLQQEEKRCFRV